MPALARRLWVVNDCPSTITTYAPTAYGPLCCALVYGGTVDDIPPEDWLNSIAATVGMKEDAAATLVLRRVDSFLWTAYWDPSGVATPVEPRIGPASDLPPGS